MRLIDWFLVALGVAGLVGVRVLEDRLFYDPFLDFFHSENKSILPKFEWIPLIGGHLFRFILNLFFSLVVVHFLFKNKKWTVQAAVLILIVFAITFPVYLFCLKTNFSIGLLFSFFIRRFVIQPLALLLIVPLFYYRKSLLEKG